MHTAHMCAADVHSQALLAIEQGLGSTAETVLHCAACGKNAEVTYAARTGMCKQCHDASICATNAGWVRCEDPCGIMEDAKGFESVG